MDLTSTIFRISLYTSIIRRCSNPGQQLRRINDIHYKRISKETLRISKTISWLLRHEGKNEGLNMGSDGYVHVQDLLNHPKLIGLSFQTLQQIVSGDAKQRFDLRRVSDTTLAGSQATAAWWIRANQGHSLSDVSLELKPVTSAAEVPMAVHGTTLTAWKLISKQGISRMDRNHIHLAQGVSGENALSVNGPSGLRSRSDILIYIDLDMALHAGVKFYVSSNGVLLTEGNEKGFLDPRFFKHVEWNKVKGRPVPGWWGANSGNEEGHNPIQDEALVVPK